MQLKTTKLFFLFILLSFFLKTEAQQWMGRTTGNYSGTYGVYNNASSISDSKYKYYFNFWGRGVNFYNNYLTYNAPVKLNQWANNTPEFLQYQDINGKVQMGNDWLLEDLNGKNKQFSFTQDIFGPAFMFPISKRWNMSINTRQRSALQMIGLSEDAARMAKNGVTNNKNASIEKGFAVNAQSYQELSFTLGGILAKNDNHKLSGGASIKFIRGLGAAYLKGNQLNIQGTSNNSALINGDFQYAYTDDQSVINPYNDPYGLFSLRSKGAGFGFDLGISYEFKSGKNRYKSKWSCDANDKRSNYDIKLSLGLNDIGGIRYNKQSTEYAFSSSINSPVSASGNILNGFAIAKQNGFDSIGQNVFAAMGATKSSGFNSSLPTALNFQADFRLSKHLYTTVYLNQSLRSDNSAGIRSTSMLSVIPRIETRSFEFSMPITLSENYKNFYLGAYTRIGPVFFGSDNLGGLLNVASASQFTGADIYGGVSFGIGHCPTRWYTNQVDPVYIDTVKNDTLRTELRDTLKMVKKDTILIKDTIKLTKRDTIYIDKKAKTVIKKDTVYIEKTNRPTETVNKELELKRKEDELNKRKIELDAKEKALIEKQKGTYNEAEVLKVCKEQNTNLEIENRTLKIKINSQDEEILRLQKELQELKTLKTAKDVEIVKCNEAKVKNDAEIIKLQRELLDANKKINELQVEITVLKKAALTKNEASVEKGTDAEKIAKANKQIDSLKLVILYLESNVEQCKKNANLDNAKAENNAKIAKKQSDSLIVLLNSKVIELENCKKNSTQNNAEIIKKAETDKAKAENDAKIAKRQADSLVTVLNVKIVELENCKKNSTQNNAEIIKKAENDKAKAENEAKIAKKQADSLTTLLNAKILELENCKKNSSQNNSEADKLKKCSDENDMLKLEMQGMSKTISTLNTKNYALTYKVDSLINALKNCCKNCSNSNTNDAELLKKCQEGKTALENEVSQLKLSISKKDKSLDSIKSVLTLQDKKQIELNAEIVKLNTEVETLKKSNSSNNCDEVKKQLDEKNAELTKVKNENTSLQNQVKTLNAQLNEYKTEYNFILKQSKECSLKLDTCIRGLNKKPAEPVNPDENTGGAGGPNNGDMGNNTTGHTEDSSGYSTSTEKISKGVKVGAQIVKILLNAATQNNNTTQSKTGSNTNSKPTETGSGGTSNSGSSNGRTSSSSGTDKPTESGSGTAGTNNSRSDSGNDSSTRRR